MDDTEESVMAYGPEQCARAREDFPALARLFNGRPLAFLDGPAGTQVPTHVLQAMSDLYTTCNTNTHGDFVTSRELDAEIWRAREVVASFLGADDPHTISFGANMTSLAFALSHAFGRIWREGDEVIVTQLDHEANRGPWLQLEERGMTVKELPIDRQGYFDLDDLRRQINTQTRLVAVSAASNALGTVNDLKKVRELTREVGAWMAVDAVHYAAHFPIDVAVLDPDFLFCSAYKFYGPHVGILYTRPGLLDTLPTDRLRTQDSEAPYRIETGSLNHAAIIGVCAAIEYIAEWGVGDSLRERIVDAMTGISRYEHTLARLYGEQVAAISGVTVWGPDVSTKRRAPTVSVTVEGVSIKEATQYFADQGLCVWRGHFYAIRPVEVLGLAERGGLIRTGISMYNTQAEIDRLLDAVATLTSVRV